MRIDGSITLQDRDMAVQTFQNDDICQVALLGITAAGTGLTLTAATTVLFAELYWTPAIMIQAEDRTHRYGQENNVNAVYLYGPNTVDELLFSRLKEKYFVVSTTLDDQKLDLNLEKISSTNNSENISPSQIQNPKADFEEFRKQIALEEGIVIQDEFEDVLLEDEKILTTVNLHEQSCKRQRYKNSAYDFSSFDEEESTYDDSKEQTANISMKKFKRIPKKIGKFTNQDN